MEMVGQAFHPNRAGFLVEMLDTAARHGDLIRAHRRVTDEDGLVVGAEGAQHLPGHLRFHMAPLVVFPQPLIGAIVKIEIVTSTKVYPGRYSMYLDKESNWKIRNININGMNLAKIFRNQFYSLMEKKEEDIEKVIKSWATSV